MKFTLIEVVVAMMILSLSLAGTLRLLSHAQMRIGAAEERWREMHMLTQGAEYMLLTGSEENLHVPDEVFPYPDYLIDCTVDDADGLPQELQDQEGQLPLKKWIIRLVRSRDREERLKVVIDRFDYASTADEEGNAR